MEIKGDKNNKLNLKSNSDETKKFSCMIRAKV